MVQNSGTGIATSQLMPSHILYRTYFAPRMHALWDIMTVFYFYRCSCRPQHVRVPLSSSATTLAQLPRYLLVADCQPCIHFAKLTMICSSVKVDGILFDATRSRMCPPTGRPARYFLHQMRRDVVAIIVSETSLDPSNHDSTDINSAKNSNKEASWT